MNAFFKYLLYLKFLTLNTAKSVSSGCLLSPKLFSGLGILLIIGGLIYFLGLSDMISGILHFLDRGPEAFKKENPELYWNEQSLDTRENFRGIYFLKSGTGWAFGHTDAFFKSDYLGAKWKKEVLPERGYLSYMKFFDENNGIILGGTNMYFTNNGGKKWQFKKTNLNIEWGVRNAFFVNENTGWIVDWYENNYVCKTINAGKSWFRQKIKTNQHPINLFFLNELTGWTSCENGWLFSTINGGKNWKGINTGTRKDINAVFFINNLTGWAVGEDITIIKTNDGGLSWQIISSYENSLIKGYTRSSKLNDIKFLNDTVGWSVGDDGIIFSTFDGGVTWLENNSKGYKELNKIYILDKRNVFVAGSEGTVLEMGYSYMFEYF